VPKGAICRISVFSKNIYQLIPWPHILANIAKAKDCAEISCFDIFFVERKEMNSGDAREHNLGNQGGGLFFCIKSLTLVPVDEQG